MNGKEKYLAISAGLLCVVLFLMMHFLGNIFLPLVIALILTYLINPLVVFLVARGVNRTLAIVAVFIALILLVTGTGILFFSSLQAEFGSVEVNLPEYARRFYEIIPIRIKAYLDIETPEKAYFHLNAALQELRGVSLDLAREAFTVASRAFSSTLSFVLALLGYIITPVYLFYFLADLPELKGSIMALVPERHRERVRRTTSEIDEVLSAFVRGQLSVCAILAVLYSVGLYFIGIDLAILIGTFAGVAFIIPYVGTILGLVLSITMALLKFHDLLHPLLCLGWIALVQLLEGSVITPKMVGTKVGLHPVIAILALLVGGQVFGLLGMLLAVPAVAVGKVFLGSLVEYYQESSFFKGC
jgi:predicted PurR-regulated permease PerM